MTDIFNSATTKEILERIGKLNSSSQPIWGKMNVAQMFAHCNVTYELAYEAKVPKATGIKKWLLKTFVKNTVVSEKPYKHNSRTAPVFLITIEKEFEKEKQRLVDYVTKTQELGADYFNQKESQSFGTLTTQEWNNMFAKHLNHHLEQFGV